MKMLDPEQPGEPDRDRELDPDPDPDRDPDRDPDPDPDSSSTEDSSSAVVDDIELILEPCELGELESFSLVRVTENKTQDNRLVTVATQTEHGWRSEVALNNNKKVEDPRGASNLALNTNFPHNLYRVKNLSRNLHLTEEECDAPAAGGLFQAIGNSRMLMRRIAPANNNQSHGSSSTGIYRTRPLGGPLSRPLARPLARPSSGSRTLRSSLPDLRHSPDSDTSELLEESEVMLRSSIDLLLRDEFCPEGAHYEYRRGSGSFGSVRFGSQPEMGLSSSSLAYAGAGSSALTPFLPRRIADLRLSRRAKVILPDGRISVVNIVQLDELSDCLQVHVKNRLHVVPFRKVVFAWK